uniref:dihydrofolate reductase n=1 Tax=Glossina palpalis gambiensis TaxID=67801 RepID=A0A1B0C4E2_9MUSC
MLKFYLIVAVSKNVGIGLKGGLPWELKSELRYFSEITRVFDSTKRNVVTKGRKTYFGIPLSNRPLRSRLNIVLSTTLTKEGELPEEVLLQPNLEAAVKFLEDNNTLESSIENI